MPHRTSDKAPALSRMHVRSESSATTLRALLLVLPHTPFLMLAISLPVTTRRLQWSVSWLYSTGVGRDRDTATGSVAGPPDTL